MIWCSCRWPIALAIYAAKIRTTSRDCEILPDWSVSDRQLNRVGYWCVYILSEWLPMIPSARNVKPGSTDVCRDQLMERCSDEIRSSREWKVLVDRSNKLCKRLEWGFESILWPHLSERITMRRSSPFDRSNVDHSPERSSSHFLPPYKRRLMDPSGLGWSKDRSEQMFYTPDRYSIRRAKNCSQKPCRTFLDRSVSSIESFQMEWQNLRHSNRQKPEEKRLQRSEHQSMRYQIRCDRIEWDLTMSFAEDLLLFFYQHHQRFQPEGMAEILFWWIEFDQTAMARNETIDQIISRGILNKSRSHFRIPIFQ